MREVAVVTDSSIELDAAQAAELGIEISPITFIIDGAEIVVTADVDRKRLIDLIAQSQKFSTSGANVEAFVTAYQRALSRARSIVVPTIARALSVTLNSAVMAAELMEDAKIKVVDSGGAYLGETAQVVAAVRLVESGASFDEVVAFAESAAKQSQCLLVSTNLAFIKGIGRVTEGRDEAGREMRLAIVRIADGKIAPFDAAAEFDEAIDKVIAEARKLIPAGQPIIAAIGHARQTELMNRLRQRVRESFNCREVWTTEEGPLCTLLGGVGAFGFGFCPAP